MSTPEPVLRRNPQVEEAPLQGELMLFDPQSARFFVLNRTMAFVWSRCDGGHTLPALLDAMESEFKDVDRAAAEGHLRQAVDELRSLGLVVDAA
jgi:PqqD family protein of HPr-rel-A system